MSGNDKRLVQSEDERQIGRRHPEVLRRLDSPLPVTVISAYVPAQSTPRPGRGRLVNAHERTLRLASGQLGNFSLPAQEWRSAGDGVCQTFEPQEMS